MSDWMLIYEMLEESKYREKIDDIICVREAIKKTYILAKIYVKAFCYS